MKLTIYAAALALAATAALAVPSAHNPFDPNDPLADELRQVRAAIAREAWAPAEARLVAMSRIAPDVPEVWSLLGFARRKQGALEAAEIAYNRALTLDPNHLGALEYMGELRLMQNDPQAAEALLARLERLCPTGCEERDELAAAIQAWREERAP